MGKIHIDYIDTMQKAKRLEEIGSKIQGSSTQKFWNIENQISTAWKGDAGDAYRRKYEKTVTSLSNQGKKLKLLAAQMEGTARRIQKIEETANNIFKR